MHPIPRLLSTTACLLLLAGCAATDPAIDSARARFDAGQPEAGLTVLEEAMKRSPEDTKLRAMYLRHRELTIASWLTQADRAYLAGRREEANQWIERARRLDPTHARVTAMIAALAQKERHDREFAEARQLVDSGDKAGAEKSLRAILAEDGSRGDVRAELDRLRQAQAATQPPRPELAPRFRKAVSLQFRDAPLPAVFTALANASGLNFVLDPEVRSDVKVTLMVRDTPLEDVLKLILLTHQLERRVLSDNTVLVHPNTPQKTRDYTHLVTRSFHLANADAKQMSALVKSVVKSRDLYVDERLNVLVMKDTPEAITLAERLIEGLDTADAEVMLDVEVLEVSRNKLFELGMRWPDQVGYGLLQGSTQNTVVTNGISQTTTVPGGDLAAGMISLKNRIGLTSFILNPALLLNIKDQNSTGNLLANPRIRVKSREKAKIHIGEKLPVFTTTSTANVGVSASVSYLDVGLKLDVEPTVHDDVEVGMKVGLEVSSIVREVAGPQQSLAYQLGTRSASTTLRLKNGETQVLAGLISDEERTAAQKVPGIGDLPIIGRLFSNQRDSNTKTEIVLLITPHIVRAPKRPDSLEARLPSGTEAQVGAAEPVFSRDAFRGGIQLASAGSALAAPISRSPASPQEAEAAPSRLVMRAPQELALNQEFALELQLTGGGETRQLTAYLAYDTSRIEAVTPQAPTPGRIPISLAANGRDAGRAHLRLRATGQSGSTSLRLEDFTLTDAAGVPQPLTAPASLDLRVTP